MISSSALELFLLVGASFVDVVHTRGPCDPLSNFMLFRLIKGWQLSCIINRSNAPTKAGKNNVSSIHAQN